MATTPSAVVADAEDTDQQAAATTSLLTRGIAAVAVAASLATIGTIAWAATMDTTAWAVARRIACSTTVIVSHRSWGLRAYQQPHGHLDFKLASDLFVAFAFTAGVVDSTLHLHAPCACCLSFP